MGSNRGSDFKHGKLALEAIGGFHAFQEAMRERIREALSSLPNYEFMGIITHGNLRKYGITTPIEQWKGVVTSRMYRDLSSRFPVHVPPISNLVKKESAS